MRKSDEGRKCLSASRTAKEEQWLEKRQLYLFMMEEEERRDLEISRLGKEAQQNATGGAGDWAGEE